MSNENMAHNEMLYQMCLYITKQMLKQNVIDSREYKKIQKKLLVKYEPYISSLNF